MQCDEVLEVPEIKDTDLSKKVKDEYTVVDNSFVRTSVSDPLDKVEVEIGDTKQPDSFYPQVKMMRWDNENNYSFRLINNDENIIISSENEKIKWIGDKIDAHFYDKQPESKVNYTTARQVDLGSLRPEQMSASFDLFRKLKQNEIVFLTYRPDREVYWLAARYDPSIDLDMGLIEKPIMRYRVRSRHYPAMFVDENTLFVDIVSPNKDVNISILNPVKKLLLQYGYDGIDDEGGRIYFEKDGKRKKLISYGTDRNHFCFYITLKAPTYNYKAAQTTRSKGSYEIGGLDEIINFDNSFIDKLIIEITNDLNLLLKEKDELSQEETQTFGEITTAYSTNDWNYRNITDYYIPIEEVAGGGYEFEVIIKDPSYGRFLNFSINNKNVKYLRQTPTVEKIIKGIFTPDHVVDSYAIYASDKKVNYVKGKKYRTGKVGHIYRPRIFDSNNRFVWGKLSIDNGILSIEIPEDFFSSALFPIYVDPTFGNTGEESSSVPIYEDEFYGTIHTGSSGTGSSMSWHSYNSSSATAVSLALYKESDGSLIDTTDEKDQAWSSDTWYTHDFSGSPSLSAIDYILPAWGDGDMKTSPAVSADFGSVYDSVEKSPSGSYDSWPDPIGSYTDADELLSIYVTYSEDSGTTYQATASDGFDLSETLARKATFPVSVTDGISGGDSPAKIAQLLAAGADGVDIGEALARIATYPKTATDGLTMAEALARVITARRTASDGIEMTDTPAVTATLLVTVGDGVDIGESPAGISTLQGSAQNGADLGDTTSRTITAQRTAVDGADIGDSPASIGTFQGGAADGADIGDAAGRVAAYQGVSTDGTDIGDSAVTKATFQGLSADGLTLSESLAATALLLALSQDGVTLSDVLTGDILALLSATVTDGFTMSDSPSVVAQFLASAAEGVDIGETLTGILTALATATDGVDFSDTSVGNILAHLISALATDGVTMSDEASKTAQLLATALDGATLSETLAVVLTALAASSDGVTLSDLPAFLRTVAGASTDGITVSDTGAVNATFRVTAADAASFSDTVSRLLTLTAVATDGLSISDVTYHFQATGIVSMTITAKQATITFEVAMPGVSFTGKKPTITIQ